MSNAGLGQLPARSARAPKNPVLGFEKPVFVEKEIPRPSREMIFGTAPIIFDIGKFAGEGFEVFPSWE
jgi:hypothetical protein